jgi:hypothetical protein
MESWLVCLGGGLPEHCERLVEFSGETFVTPETVRSPAVTLFQPQRARRRRDRRVSRRQARARRPPAPPALP